MMRVALTGSIGAGKTTLLNVARAEGFPVFSADAAVHQLYSTNPILIQNIGENFPGSVTDGAINRATLAKLIYAGDVSQVRKAATKLRRLVAPYVQTEMDQFLEDAKTKSKVAVCEIPFLFESGMYRAFDLTVNLAISEDVQRARVLERDKGKGMDVALLNKIRGLFFSESVRECMADVNLDANLTADALSKQFLRVLQDDDNQVARRLDMRQRPPLVWFVGATSSGKTAIAEKGIVPLGYHSITGSRFFRESFGRQEIDYLEEKPLESFSPEEIAALKQKFVGDISEHSTNVLQDNPHCNVDYIQACIRRAGMPCVLEGFRNPFEFMQLYDPAKDMVIFLDRPNADRYDTIFERGIDVIKQNVRWCVDASLAPPGSVYDISFGGSQIEVRRFTKGSMEPISSRHFENADDYALIDHIKMNTAPYLVADYYADNGLLLQPTQRQKISQRRYEL